MAPEFENVKTQEVTAMTLDDKEPMEDVLARLADRQSVKLKKLQEQRDELVRAGQAALEVLDLIDFSHTTSEYQKRELLRSAVLRAQA